MRILITSPTYPPFNSGLGNAVALQAAGLAAAGHQVVVATGGESREHRMDGSIRVESFPVSGAASLLNPIRGEVAAYRDLLCHTAWDVILLNAWQNWATDLALRYLGHISGRKFVYSHCISTNSYFARQPLRSLVRYLAWRPYWWRLPHAMRRLDGVLFLADRGCDSRFDDLAVARRCAVPLHIIPNSLSDAAVAALDAPAKPLAVRDKLIAVGSYQWLKGFDFVLRAYAASRARDRFPLHLYGQQHSAYSDTLRSLMRALGLGERHVTLHEGVSGEDLIAEYSRSRLVLSGSHTECQPLVLLDANATGTPFVARSTGCIDGMPGGRGIDTWQDMAAHIDALLDDLPAWETLSADGRQAARDLYHPEQTSRLLLRALT